MGRLRIQLTIVRSKRPNYDGPIYIPSDKLEKFQDVLEKAHCNGAMLDAAARRTSGWRFVFKIVSSNTGKFFWTGAFATRLGLGEIVIAIPWQQKPGGGSDEPVKIYKRGAISAKAIASILHHFGAEIQKAPRPIYMF